MTKEMKACTKCKEVKGLECFHKVKNKRDGLAGDCKGCRKDYHKRNRESRLETAKNWREANPKYAKRWRQNNKVAKAEYAKKYRQENKDAMAEYDKRYRQENKGKYKAWKAKRRATKLNATPPWLTDRHHKDIRNIYDEATRMSKRGGVKYHVDHIVPLQGKNVCGLHVPWNLQILTAEENLSKNNSHSDWD